MSDEPEASLVELIAAARARRVLIEVSYNRGRSLLAPHSLFRRHGDLHLRAVTVERDGRPPANRKLGTFKLSGLSDATLSRRLFSPAAVFAPLGSEAPVREGVEEVL